MVHLCGAAASCPRVIAHWLRGCGRAKCPDHVVDLASFYPRMGATDGDRSFSQALSAELRLTVLPLHDEGHRSQV